MKQLRAPRDTYFADARTVPAYLSHALPAAASSSRHADARLCAYLCLQGPVPRPVPRLERRKHSCPQSRPASHSSADHNFPHVAHSRDGHFARLVANVVRLIRVVDFLAHATRYASLALDDTCIVLPLVSAVDRVALRVDGARQGFPPPAGAHLARCDAHNAHIPRDPRAARGAADRRRALEPAEAVVRLEPASRLRVSIS